MTRPGFSRRSLLIGPGAVVPFALAGAALAQTVPGQPSSGKPIRVGSSLPLTGALASPGQIHKVAGQIFVEQINMRGGLLGRPVEWVLADDQSQAASTRSIYERLLTVDKVDLLMGPYGTSSVLAAMGIAQRYEKLFIQSSLGNMSLATYERQFPSLPTGPHPETTGAEILFDAFASTPTPPKTVAIVTSKFPSALFLADGARKVAEKRGLGVALFLDYEFGTRDFGSIAARVKDAHPDLLWMGAIGLEGNQLLEAMQKLDYKPQRHFYIFPAAGAMASATGAEGATAYTWFEEHPPLDTVPGAAAFIKLFDERSAEAGLPWPHVDHQAGGEYAAWQILEAAAVGTGSLDDKAMARWIKANKVQTILGPLRFDGIWNTGEDLTKIKQLQGGTWTVVWPVAFRAPGTSFKLP